MELGNLRSIGTWLEWVYSPDFGLPIPSILDAIGLESGANLPCCGGIVFLRWLLLRFVKNRGGRLRVRISRKVNGQPTKNRKENERWHDDHHFVCAVWITVRILSIFKKNSEMWALALVSLQSPFIHQPYTLLHTCEAPSTTRVSPISIYSSTIHTVNRPKPVRRAHE